MKAEAGLNKIFNVMQYGVVPDTYTDNSKVGLFSISLVSEWQGESTIMIPKGTFMLHPVKFIGNSPNVFYTVGVLKATTGTSKDVDWIRFENINGLTVTGGGMLNGQGASAWGHQCKSNCKPFSAQLITHWDLAHDGWCGLEKLLEICYGFCFRTEAILKAALQSRKVGPLKDFSCALGNALMFIDNHVVGYATCAQVARSLRLYNYYGSCIFILMTIVFSLSGFFL